VEIFILWLWMKMVLFILGVWANMVSVDMENLKTWKLQLRLSISKEKNSLI